MDKWRVRPLGENEEINGFSCGNLDLDDYFITAASSYQVALLAKNYVLEDESANIVALFTLFNDRVCITDFDNTTDFNKFRSRRFVQAKRLKGYPAIKIGRLGVATSMKGKGIGSMLLDFIKSYFVNHQRSGCRFITVDAYIQAVDFYSKNGFLPMSQFNDGETLLMCYDLMDCKDLF